MKVTKIITFAAGHRLSEYQGKCRRLHGHNYKLEATVERAELDTTGFVIDFGDLKVELNKISDLFDHKLILRQNDALNEKLQEVLMLNGAEDTVVWMADNPTAENMAKLIAKMLAEEIVCDKISIKLWETDSSFVEYVLDLKV